MRKYFFTNKKIAYNKHSRHKTYWLIKQAGYGCGFSDNLNIKTVWGDRDIKRKSKRIWKTTVQLWALWNPDKITDGEMFQAGKLEEFLSWRAFWE